MMHIRGNDMMTLMPLYYIDILKHSYYDKDIC